MRSCPRGARRDSPSSTGFGIWHPHLTTKAIMFTRFYPLIKLEKVEEEEMKALLENVPDRYAAMLCENQNYLT